MPHDRLRFAWIPPPRTVRLPRRCVRQERQPMKKRRAPNAQPLCDTSDIGRTSASEPKTRYPHGEEMATPGRNALPAREEPPSPQPIPNRPQKKAARISRRERGPPAHWLPGVEEFTSSFFFRWPPPKLKRLRFGLRSSGFYPQMVCDHLVHQRERYKSVESRINLLLGTPPRYCDVDGTRDWSRLSNTKTINSRVGDDSIGRDFRARKRAICYPQSCTFLTFPHASNRRMGGEIS